jgi:site-specific DNA-cytosine methylase
MLWRGGRQPILDWIDRPYTPLNKWKPEHGLKQYVQEGRGSDDELVGLLYKLAGGREALYDCIYSTRTAFTIAQEIGLQKQKFKTERYEKLFRRAEYKAVLDVTPTFVIHHTNALMWKVTTYMLNPVEDRFMSIRELMSMMGLPKDYEEIPKRFMNHIFQNVPVTTVKTLVEEIVQALDNKRQFKKVPFMKVNNIKKQIDSTGYTYNSLKYE